MPIVDAVMSVVSAFIGIMSATRFMFLFNIIKRDEKVKPDQMQMDIIYDKCVSALLHVSLPPLVSMSSCQTTARTYANYFSQQEISLWHHHRL